MRVVVNGRNIEITDAIKAYAKEKFGKILNHYDQIQMIELTLSVVKNPSVSANHLAEAICKLPSQNIVSEEKAESMYAAIDLLADKLGRQIRKYKEKQLNNRANDTIRKESIEKIEDNDNEKTSIEE